MLLESSALPKSVGVSLGDFGGHAYRYLEQAGNVGVPEGRYLKLLITLRNCLIRLSL